MLLHTSTSSTLPLLDVFPITWRCESLVLSSFYSVTYEDFWTFKVLPQDLSVVQVRPVTRSLENLSNVSFNLSYVNQKWTRLFHST